MSTEIKKYQEERLIIAEIELRTKKNVFKYGMLFEFVCIPVGKINYQAFDLNFQHSHP